MKQALNVTLGDAKDNAEKLSVEFWNTFYHVVENDDKTYSVSKYYDEQAVCYYIKGKFYNHIKR